jgi:ABC-2 type transport system ATP-binding protein
MVEGSLELDQLTRQFGTVVALDGLTFSVPPGQVFGFLGPNGSGKTTAMRAIVGVTSLDSGTVRWRGGAVDRARVGYMPEERGLYPGMRVADQLEYFARLHDVPPTDARRASAAWIERLGLGGRETSKVESLSLGNQQRVQLAAALVHEPELLVLDEPFSGLDPGGIDAMSEVLAERARAGVTMLFSSHQLDLVEHLCDSVAIISQGRTVALGTVEELARGGPLRVRARVAGDTSASWTTGLGGSVSADGTVVIGVPDRQAAQEILEKARAGGDVEEFGFMRRRLSEVFRDATSPSEPKGPALPGLRSEERATREGDALWGPGGKRGSTV